MTHEHNAQIAKAMCLRVTILLFTRVNSLAPIGAALPEQDFMIVYIFLEFYGNTEVEDTLIHVGITGCVGGYFRVLLIFIVACPCK